MRNIEAALTADGLERHQILRTSNQAYYSRFNLRDWQHLPVNSSHKREIGASNRIRRRLQSQIQNLTSQNIPNPESQIQNLHRIFQIHNPTSRSFQTKIRKSGNLKTIPGLGLLLSNALFSENHKNACHSHTSKAESRS